MRDSATSTTASTPVYQRVRRTRIESSMALPGGRNRLDTLPRQSTFVRRVRGVRIAQWTKQVAGAAGMEQGFAGIGVNFAAHAVDVDFDQVREGIESLIPNMLGDFRAPHDAAGVARKIFEQGVLFGGKRHASPCPGNALRASIQDEISNRNLGRAKFTGAAKQRAEAREQLAEFERFGEVVVSAMIEAGDTVLHGIARGQHQNGHALA